MGFSSGPRRRVKASKDAKAAPDEPYQSKHNLELKEGQTFRLNIKVGVGVDGRGWVKRGWITCEADGCLLAALHHRPRRRNRTTMTGRPRAHQKVGSS